MITLCSKCYYVDEPDSGEKKFSTKGMSQRRNNITWQRFKVAPNGITDNGRMATYEQHKMGLSAYYDKRWLLLDGIHPIEFHMT